MFFSAPSDQGQTPAYVPHAVMNHAGQLIMGYNANEPRPPASLTKMMSLYGVMDAISNPEIPFDLDTPVSIPALITRLRPDLASFKKLSPGDVFRAGDLMIGAGSRSDVYGLTALALHVGQIYLGKTPREENEQNESFINQMNAQAQKLGMLRSVFKNCTGEPADGHLSTPADLALLTRALHLTFPDLSKHALGQAEFSIAELTTATRHSSDFLRQNRNIVFAKTGYTDSAGNCLAVCDHPQTPEKQEPLYAVIMGVKTKPVRDAMMDTLLTHARMRIQGGTEPA
ncbi:MAG: D-alanyl-D-alanine carboxypeptidase [Alphaproteobacteria bacterium]|nr:D-alanyl-D-alanine carboxypeptidase [Alphaproteobacteria bacterium]